MAIPPSAVTRSLRCSSRRSGLFDQQRGSAGIEKIIIIGVFVFGIVCGLRAFAFRTDGSLRCHGRNALNPDNPVACVDADAAEKPRNTPPPKCTGANCMCFVAGTLVVTRDGLQPIETIVPGTLVLSRPEDGGDEPDWRPVLQAFTSTSRGLVRLTTVNRHGGREIFEVTGNHPFFTESDGWTDARHLIPGADLLIDGEGQPVQVLHAETFDRQVPVYNFEVAEFHTYFVGHSGIWVHNRPAEIGDRLQVDVDGELVNAVVVGVGRSGSLTVRVHPSDGRSFTRIIPSNRQGWRNQAPPPAPAQPVAGTSTGPGTYEGLRRQGHSGLPPSPTPVTRVTNDPSTPNIANGSAGTPSTSASSAATAPITRVAPPTPRLVPPNYAPPDPDPRIVRYNPDSKTRIPLRPGGRPLPAAPGGLKGAFNTPGLTSPNVVVRAMRAAACVFSTPIGRRIRRVFNPAPIRPGGRGHSRFRHRRCLRNRCQRSRCRCNRCLHSHRRCHFRPLRCGCALGSRVCSRIRITI
jgi:hypothetical protein